MPPKIGKFTASHNTTRARWPPVSGLQPPVSYPRALAPIPTHRLRCMKRMRRDYIKWYSPSLHRDMELLAFGERGFPIVVFPTSGGQFWEYEDRGMVNALAPKIERGELQVICLDSVDRESWYNEGAHPADRLHRQNAFDAYLVNEAAPFV